MSTVINVTDHGKVDGSVDDSDAESDRLSNIIETNQAGEEISEKILPAAVSGETADEPSIGEFLFGCRSILKL